MSAEILNLAAPRSGEEKTLILDKASAWCENTPKTLKQISLRRGANSCWTFIYRVSFHFLPPRGSSRLRRYRTVIDQKSNCYARSHAVHMLCRWCTVIPSLDDDEAKLSIIRINKCLINYQKSDQAIYLGFSRISYEIYFYFEYLMCNSFHTNSNFYWTQRALQLNKTIQ